MRVFLTFLRAEAGAVTVDWVVLTAAITGLGLASAAAVRSGTGALGDQIESSLTSAEVVTIGELGHTGASAGPVTFDWVNRDMPQTYFDEMRVQLQGLPEASLAAMYQGFVTEFEFMTATGDLSWGRTTLDQYMAPIYAAMVDNGYTLPTPSPTELLAGCQVCQ